MLNQLASFLEVIIAAKEQMHFEDFKTGGRLAGDIRSGYQARMVAFSALADSGFVILESGKLMLGVLSEESWLTSSLTNGDPESWAICDAFPSKLRKFNPDSLNLEQIGREGEDFLVSWLKSNLDPQLHSEIVQTSLTDDSAGYDIVSPSLKLQGQMKLEVKTSTRSGDVFTFHLSRNEWATAARNFNWYLVLVNKTQGKFSVFGYLDSQSLVSYYPNDSHLDFKWTSTVGVLGPDDVFSGVPGF